MLKSLLQLFAETFLKSKKSWVGVQGMPSTKETVISATMDATWRTYVAPEDGYVVFQGGTSQFLMYNMLGSVGSGVNYGGVSRLFRGFIPIRKGCTLYYFVEGSDSSSRLSFTPCEFV